MPSNNYNIYERLLNNVYFTVIIWENKDNVMSCVFSNKNSLAKTGLMLDIYLNTNKNLKNKYDKLITTKSEQTMTVDKEEITLYYLPDAIYYEIRTNIKDEYNYNLLSGISSKIRNPLTNIIGSIYALQESKLTKAQHQHIGIIEKSNFEIISLTNDIVDIINLGQNKIKLNIEYVDLKKCITEIIEIINEYQQKNDVNIVFTVSPDVPNFVKIDKIRLKQILINIINFSIKNTDLGSITTEISIYDENKYDCPFDYIQTEKPKYNILFKIKDTGVALDKENIECLENLLTIKQHTTIKKYHDYEFSFIINKYLCNLMSGNLWFKSDVNFGTTYYLNIICDCYN